MSKEQLIKKREELLKQLEDVNKKILTFECDFYEWVRYGDKEDHLNTRDMPSSIKNAIEITEISYRNRVITINALIDGIENYEQDCDVILLDDKLKKDIRDYNFGSVIL